MTGVTVADHWWWRPGWRPGRRMYTFHVTFGNQPAVLGLAERAQGRLAGLPGLDMVPLRWLHLTTQGIGFTDEVKGTDVEAIVSTARNRLAAVTPVRVTIGPARPVSEGIACAVTPGGTLDPIRNGLRDAIADVWSPDRVPDEAAWEPHVSLAYSNRSGPADDYAAALAGHAEVAPITVGAVELIVLGRDRHVYEWDVHSTVPLSPGGAGGLP